MGKVAGYGPFYVKDESVLLDIDGGAHEATKAYLNKYIKLSYAEMIDLRETHGQISVQGPNSRALVESISGLNLSGFVPFQHATAQIAERTVTIAKIFRTGEDGYDISVENDAMPAVWDALITNGNQFGAIPAGFAALNIARIEAGFLCSESITTRTISWSKPIWIAPLATPKAVTLVRKSLRDYIIEDT